MPEILYLPTVVDSRGSLMFAESKRHVPFKIERIFCLYNTVQSRGGHAHKKCEQFIIALAGSFRVVLQEKDSSKASYILDRPDKGLYIKPLTWVDVVDFSPESICMVFASELYDDADYIRNYQDYLSVIK